MNTSQLSAPSHTHTPSSGAEGWLLAPRAETETRTRAGDNSNGCAISSPHGLAGSGGILPRLIRRTNSQRVTSMCHSVLSATGAASLRMAPKPSLLSLAGRVFGPPLFGGE